MLYLKRFWTNIKNSFYNPVFYTDARTKKFKSPFLVLLALSCVLSLTLIIQILIFMVPFALNFSANTFIDSYYPQNLELTAKNNQFSSNVEEPFFIPVTDEEIKMDTTIENAVVIDTKNELTLKQITDYNSFVVIVKEGIVIQQERGELETLSLKESELGDFVISESNLNIWAETILTYIQVLIIPFAILFIILFPIMILVGFLFMSLFGSLIVLIIGLIKKVPIRFAEAYLVAMYAIIPGTLLSGIVGLFALNVPSILNLLIFIIVVSINLKQAPIVSEDIVQV